MLSLVAAGLGWAITTPLCLWQSRAWLDELELLPIPEAQLNGRDFYLMCRETEWAPMAREIAGLTRTVLERETLPAMRLRMPSLPHNSIVITP
jgi:DNA-binding transcriptional LysR family regulator